MLQYLLSGRVAMLAILVLAAAPSPALAQLDRLYPTTGSAVTGRVSNITRDGVSIQVGSATQNFSVDAIRKVTFEGDPPGLTRGRDLVLERQYQSAVEQLRQVNATEISREYVAADAVFYRLAAEAQLALAGQGDKAAVARGLQRFATQYKDNFHFYQAAELLGDLAIASGDFAASGRYYNALLSSEVPLVAARGRYLLATALLRQGKHAEAITGFDTIVGASLESAEGIRLKTLARAGRAVATARAGKGQEALEVANELVASLNPEDHELAARIYNARGSAHEALGDDEGALLDYLHTHLLFSSIGDAHAEALTRMIVLWPKVGQPERATEARQELQTRYPGWNG